MSRILVLGGAGLVGSHLCDRLLSLGHQVICVDDLSSGSYANIAHLKEVRDFVFEEHDVAKPFRADVNAIFHLAMPSTKNRCQHDPGRSAVTCVSGTRNALEVAAQTGARVVMGSALPRHGHGARCAEELAEEYRGTRGVDARVVRIPLTYGPRMALDYDSELLQLMLPALKGRGVEVEAPRAARALRLTYVDDAVTTLVRTMNAPHHLPPVIAPSVETIGLRVAELVAQAARADVPSMVVSNAAVAPPSQNLLGVPPSLNGALPAALVLGSIKTMELREGITRTFTWLKGQMDLLADAAARASLSWNAMVFDAPPETRP